MVKINYEKKYCLPESYDLALKHFEVSKYEANWRGKAVHLIVGVLELIPLINLIVVIADKRFLNKPTSLEVGLAKLGIQTRQDFAFRLDTTPETLTQMGIRSKLDLQTLGLMQLRDVVRDLKRDLWDIADQEILLNRVAEIGKKLEYFSNDVFIPNDYFFALSWSDTLQELGKLSPNHQDLWNLFETILKKDKDRQLAMLRAYLRQDGLQAAWQVRNLKTLTQVQMGHHFSDFTSLFKVNTWSLI